MNKTPKNKEKRNSNTAGTVYKALCAAAALLLVFAVLLIIDKTTGGIIFGSSPTPSEPPVAIGTAKPTAVPTPTPSPTPVPTPVPTPTPTPEPWNTVTVQNSDITAGFQILVNYQYPFAHTDEIKPVSITENKSDTLFIGEDRLLDETALKALNAFADAFHKASGDFLFITSAYRDYDYQERVYQDYIEEHGEEAAAMYVAKPGYSEHHTGLAVDLSTVNAAGERKPIANHEYEDWINEHCADYGFILRYPLDKAEITHVAYEPWHYRYIGCGNAKAVTALGFTYEEYIEHLRQYSFETEMLYVSENGEIDALSFTVLPDSGWVIYYVPASQGSTTNIKLPLGYSEYSVSGNNDDGFIVTVTLG